MQSVSVSVREEGLLMPCGCAAERHGASQDCLSVRIREPQACKSVQTGGAGRGCGPWRRVPSLCRPNGEMEVAHGGGESSPSPHGSSRPGLSPKGSGRAEHCA